MHTIGRHRFRVSLVAAAAVLLVACNDDSSLGPVDQLGVGSEALADQATARWPDLGTCGNLQVDAGSKLAYHVYAVGVQRYHWNGTSWAFDGPSAKLYADAGAKSVVGTHYAGPTWESLSGSTVVGAVRVPCPRGAADVPWLLLDAVSTDGPGIFRRVALIQRVNTVGGQAPSEAGTLGEVRNVPYTAEYYFYRAP